MSTATRERTARLAALAGRSWAELEEHAERLVHDGVPRALALVTLREEGWRWDESQLALAAARRRLRVCPQCGHSIPGGRTT